VHHAIEHVAITAGEEARPEEVDGGKRAPSSPRQLIAGAPMALDEPGVPDAVIDERTVIGL
jgi:hypothetical protein